VNEAWLGMILVRDKVGLQALDVLCSLNAERLENGVEFHEGALVFV